MEGGYSIKRIIRASLPYIVATTAGLLLFIVAHTHATQVRGYVAYGGELFLLFMPAVLVNFFRVTISEGRKWNEQKKDKKRLPR